MPKTLQIPNPVDVAAIRQALQAWPEGLPMAAAWAHPRLQWDAGTLSVVAAPTSAGKTTFLLWQILEWLTQHDTPPILLWSCEMDKPHLVARMIGMLSDRSMWDVVDQERRGMLDPEAYQAWEQFTAQAHRLVIVDEPTNAATLFRQSTQLAQQSPGLAAVVVDYLQELPPYDPFDHKAQRLTGSRELEVGLTAVILRELARRLQIPVIAAAQLNRQVNRTSEYVPDLLQIRESGRIEQNAALVIGIRNETMSGAEPPDSSIAKWPKTTDTSYTTYEGADQLRRNRLGAQMAVRDQAGDDAILMELFVLKNRMRGGVGAVIPVAYLPESGAFTRLTERFDPPGSQAKPKSGSIGARKNSKGKVIHGGFKALSEAREETGSYPSFDLGPDDIPVEEW